jgi:ATP-binding cassette, subfamily B, bacterial
LLWPIRQMGRILADMGKTTVALGRIKEILDHPREDIEEGGLKPPIKGDIEFKNVYFSYNGSEEVLKDLSFTIKAGQTVAVMGPTGSGKSSLVHLLQGLYPYKKGSIKIDGVELRDINKKYIRKQIGIVLQEPFLFSKTLGENIALTKGKAKKREIFEAARAASIHDVIESFDKGYETPVGERGVTLSGGQKQRIAIARTLIQKAPILIFDDSLSAVDTQTDADIRKALNKKSKDSTTIIISHRITTIEEADYVLVLEDGKVVQWGAPQELKKQEGLYKRIWEIQSSLKKERA